MVYCTVSERAHAMQASSPLGVDAYREYAAMLWHDSAAARAAAARGPCAAEGGPQAPPWHELSVGVKHLPLGICALDNSSFVLPAAGAAATRAVAGQRAAGFAQVRHWGGIQGGPYWGHPAGWA